MQIDSCPWGSSAINYKFVICEEALCAWIRQPANTWSNLGMLLIGLFLFFRGIRGKLDSDTHFGVCIIFMGLASFGAHASGSFLFGFLDVTSIFIYLGLLATISLLREKVIARTKLYFVWAAIASTLILFQVILPKLQILTLIILGIFILFSEGRYVWKNQKNIQTMPLFIGIGILALAATCLALDYTKLFCDPENHFFQFHAAWHILAAVGMYFITNYLVQFKLTFRRS